MSLIEHQQPPSPPQPDRTTASVGIVGARGHTGAELLRLIDAHPCLSLAFASSRKSAGEAIRDAAPGSSFDGRFVDSSPKLAHNHDADIYVLALPNGASGDYIQAIDEARGGECLIVDLSADHRFDDSWVYGLPEVNADRLHGARRIANPGCFATAMLLALSPFADKLAARPHVFGVSGYSGAGTTPSPRNDVSVLRDNILPYQLTGHLHEREVSHHLGQPIRFAPHVAPFFRGITITAMAQLREPTDPDALRETCEAFYQSSPFVRVASDEAPLVRDAVDRVHATIGGFAVDASSPCDITLIATLDNLLKGAASQAIQNINLACGFDPREGLAP